MSTKTIPSNVSENFELRNLDEILEMTTTAEQAGRAADVVREDCFRQHVAKAHIIGKWAGDKYIETALVVKYFDNVWVEEEKRILTVHFRNKSRKNLTGPEKKDFNNKSNPFRSAKSVILSAVLHGYPVIDEDGMPIGKSELQDLIREEKDPLKKFNELLMKLDKLISKLPDDDAGVLEVEACALERLATAVRARKVPF